MTKTVRLDIRDLPRDPQHYQGQLRTEIVKMANYVRKFPMKADALVELLEFTIGHVNANIAVEAAPVVIEEVAPTKAPTKKAGK